MSFFECMPHHYLPCAPFVLAPLAPRPPQPPLPLSLPSTPSLEDPFFAAFSPALARAMHHMREPVLEDFTLFSA